MFVAKLGESERRLRKILRKQPVKNNNKGLIVGFEEIRLKAQNNAGDIG